MQLAILTAEPVETYAQVKYVRILFWTVFKQSTNNCKTRA